MLQINRNRQWIPLLLLSLIAGCGSNQTGPINEDQSSSANDDISASSRSEYSLETKAVSDPYSSRFFIVLGSFKNKSDAEKIHTGLVFDTALFSNFAPGFFAAVEGPFPSRQDAEQRLADLQKDFPQAYVKEAGVYVGNAGQSATRIGAIPSSVSLWSGEGQTRIVLSADTSQVAYVAISKEERRKLLVVRGGVPGETYDDIVEVPVFSQDGKSLAYSAKQNGKSFIVLNGSPGKEYEGADSLHFVGSSSEALAFVAEEKGKSFAVVNGVEGKRYDAVSNFALSEDGNTVAYIAKEGEKYFVVTNGKEWKLYDVIYDLAIAPRTKRVAYSAALNTPTGQKVGIVADDLEGKWYESVSRPVFSPEGEKIAYWAYLNKKQKDGVMVFDGQELSSLHYAWNPIISSDDHLMAYMADLDNETRIVLWDLRANNEIYNWNWAARNTAVPWSITFRPDGKELAYATGFGGGRPSVAIASDEFATGGRKTYFQVSSIAYSPDGKTLAYSARESRDPSEFLVVGQTEGQRHGHIISGPSFSPDGKEITSVVLDGNVFFKIKENVSRYE